MWQMKEWFLKFVVQAVWRRRKGVYYAVSVVSIAGNLVVLVGPSVQASLISRSVALHAAWSALPQVAEVVLHRSVLYILLNLIVVRIVVKSGVLSHTTGLPAKPDEFCLPSSYGVGYYGVRSLPWPVANSSYTVHGTTQSALAVVPMLTDTSKWSPQARSSDDNSRSTMAEVCTEMPGRQHPSINKLCSEEKKLKRAPAPSLFTIEPLEELVQATERHSLANDQDQNDKALKRPLRKVASQRVDLHRSTQGGARAEVRQRKKEQSMELVVLATAQGDDGEKAEHEDNRLSRQEFNARVDTFIFKFKRSLTMQRQDSLNRLLGLVGGGGNMRLLT